MPENKKIKREVRRSQVVQPFGVGGIYDIKGEAFVGCDITEWREPEAHKIKLPRLSAYLSNIYLLDIQYFCAPPTPPEDGEDSAESGKLPYMRFPRWLFCSNKKCERMYEWGWDDETGDIPKCQNILPDSGEQCGHTLTPVRLVLICPAGHMQDVPWPEWLHSEFGQGSAQQGCRHRDQLIWTVKDGAGGSLYSVVVECLKCEARASLGDATESRAWVCRGKQPWEPDGGNPARCKGTNAVGKRMIKAVHRGSASIYYPQTESAIDIPPYAWYSSRDLQSEYKSNEQFCDLIDKARGVPDWQSQFSDKIEDTADKLRITSSVLTAEVEKQLKKLEELEDAKDIKTTQDLLYGEWNALMKAERSKHRKDYFIVEKVDLEEVKPAEFGEDAARVDNLLSRLTAVRCCERLREVRSLVGFKRLEVGDHYPLIQADLGRNEQWRPGIEVFGEGIFIAFDHEALRTWEFEQASFIAERFDRMKSRLEGEGSVASQWVRPELLSPSFVMLHTLSHILIRQLAFECGYGASSLRERLYSDAGNDQTMSGILIYTSENDCEGSLGGLVSQGAPARLFPLMLTALDQAEWCSNDPLCRTLWQGREGLNRGACHACSLVGETSCDFGNILLDRMLVVGAGGFLEAAVHSLEE